MKAGQWQPWPRAAGNSCSGKVKATPWLLSPKGYETLPMVGKGANK